MASPLLIDAAYDAALAYVADRCDYLCLCSAEPTTYAEAYVTYMLAKVEVDEGDGNGDFDIANNDGAGAGRMLTVAEQASVSVTTGAPTTATHVALVDTTGDPSGVLLAHTPLTNTVNVTAGTTVTIPSFALRFKDVV